MKELYVTKGRYAGRILQLEDSVASSATADGWATEIPEGGIQSPEDGTDMTEMVTDLPQSLLDFQDAIDRGGTSDDPDSASLPPIGEGSEGGGDGGSGGGGGDVAPTLSSLDPNTAVLNSADLTLHCYGTGFTSSSVIRFAGQDEPTTFVSDTEVTTGVKPSLGWGEVSVPVLVKNGTAESASLNFTFTAPVVE